MFSSKSSPQPHPKGELYEKPHLVVDFKPIEEAKILLEECEAFISLSNQSMVVLPFPGLSRIRKWREKRRDDQLSTMYANLQKRVQDSERVLRCMIGEIVEKKRALRLQGRYLIARLDSCMTFNCDMLTESDTPVVDIRATVNNLSSASVQVKSMMVFNSEILRQRSVQAVRHGKSFMPWTKRPTNKPLSEAELNADPDHPVLQRRLHDLRESRGKYMEFLANSLESRETYTSNLESCATSKQMLQAVLQRDSIKDDPGAEVVPPFDHSRCTDCSYARAITADCIDHLTALHNQAMTASRRLQALVEVREQMRDLAESMELSDGSKLAADESAIGAIEGTGGVGNYRNLPAFTSPRSPPSSPVVKVGGGSLGGDGFEYRSRTNSFGGDRSSFDRATETTTSSSSDAMSELESDGAIAGVGSSGGGGGGGASSRPASAGGALERTSEHPSPHTHHHHHHTHHHTHNNTPGTASDASLPSPSSSSLSTSSSGTNEHTDIGLSSQSPAAGAALETGVTNLDQAFQNADSNHEQST